jgi:hypothetical protein
MCQQNKRYPKQKQCSHFVKPESHIPTLTLNLLTWRICRAPDNASKWQMGFNSAFKGLRASAKGAIENLTKK